MIELGSMKRNILQEEFYLIQLQYLPNKLVYKSSQSSTSDKPEICTLLTGFLLFLRILNSSTMTGFKITLRTLNK